MLCLRLFLACIISLLGAGCAATSARGTEHVPWQTAPQHLRRVAVLTELGDAGPEKLRDEKMREINEIVRTAFGSLYAVELVESEGIDQSLCSADWTQATDRDLTLAARKHGIDTMALVSVDRYAGTLALGFFPLPGWSASTEVIYRLRVLDAETAAVLADIERRRRTGGYLGFSRGSYLARDFRRDLTEVLAIEPAAR